MDLQKTQKIIALFAMSETDFFKEVEAFLEKVEERDEPSEFLAQCYAFYGACNSKLNCYKFRRESNEISFEDALPPVQKLCLCKDTFLGYLSEDVIKTIRGHNLLVEIVKEHAPDKMEFVLAGSTALRIEGRHGAAEMSFYLNL